MQFKKVSFEDHFSLNFGASNQKRTYGFSCEEFENDALKNQIFYEVEVDFLSDRSGRNCVFEISRKQIYINNKAVGLKIEQIAHQAAQTIFPLRIKTKPNGEIEEILNYTSIKKRWLDERPNFQKYYKGEKLAKVIAKIDALLLHDAVLKEFISQSWFFHLFFKPLYISYTEKLSSKHIWESPVFGNQSIRYEAIHTIKEHYSATDKININVAGVAVDEKSIDEIISGYNFPKSKLSQTKGEPVVSKMQVDYQLYAEDRSIFSIAGSFETRIDENTQHKIKTEIYHLAESASFRPWSNAAQKESQRIFDSYQNFDVDNKNDTYDYFFDLTKQAKKTSEPIVQNPLYKRETIELFVEEIFPEKKVGFWTRIKTVFKKNKKE